MVGGELFLQTPARLKQPLGAVLGDRPTLALALGVQRAAPLAHPRSTALRAGDELAGIELERDRRLALRRRFGCLVAFAGQALLGLAQRLAPALPGPELLGQLVAAPVAVEIVLAGVDLGGLGKDSRARSERSRRWRRSTRSPRSSSRRSPAPRPTPAPPARTARARRKTPPRAAARAGSGTRR